MSFTSEVFSIGVDLGATNLRIASDADGVEFLDVIRVPTDLTEGRDQVVRDMFEALDALAARKYGSRRLAGIGIGTPGSLELPNGILRNPPNLPSWDGFNLRLAVGLPRPEVLQAILFELQKAYILGAQLGTSAGLLGACLLPL